MSRARASAPTLACAECGETVIRWVGRCPACKAWGSITQPPAGLDVASVGASLGVTAGPVRAAAAPIGQIPVTDVRTATTGSSELDRVLGGGLVPGAVVLLAGEPGVGKSTLLLSVAASMAGGELGPVLLVSGEESAAQVRLRAQRIDAAHDNLYVAAENDLSALLSHIEAVQPGLLIVDSVQTITSPAAEGIAGSVSQIRAVTAALAALAKRRNMAAVLVGHVTKDGAIAGPRLLEHLVDVVLHFEGDRHSALRLVRGVKNRYGPADELGCFEMREDGIIGIADPSGLFVADRAKAAIGGCVTVTHEGRRALAAEIQTLVTPTGHGGAPRRAVADLDSARVAMVLAVLMRHGRVRLGDADVHAATVGGIAVREPAADLAIAIAAASAATETLVPPTLCAIGEVALSGDIRRVGGMDRRLAEAARLGFRVALAPIDDIGSAPPGLRIVPVGHIADALHALESLGAETSRPRPTALRAVRS